ncbi:50S ribosomal protein L17 [Anaplasmataceae bacterium AB001_6]|nr:50S ribosomal protein L17 [Anaplasmataceae bacterium AB001_6]
MRHGCRLKKLNCSSSHRKALLVNQCVSLVKHGQIRTTLAKAKTVRPFTERIVTLAKKGSLHNRRIALSRLFNNKEVISILFNEFALRYSERNGGYLRIIKDGYRKGDCAPMAIIQFV